MRRLGALLLASAAALGCCAQAFALSTTSADARLSATIADAAGLQIITSLTLPSVTTMAVGPNAAVAASNTPRTTSGTSTGNATFTIRGQVGDAVSMAVPESFTVIRNGGTEALRVTTNTKSEYGIADDGVVLGGAVMGSNSMSVNVGGSVALASAGQLEPGAYEGLLVVVVQYN